MNKVICLLPIYLNDKAEYFEIALKSLINQPCDIVILCDGPISSEHEQVINKFKDRLVVLRFKENRGLAAVLNEGIRYALEHNYEFIARMDADDISMPNRIEQQVNFLIANHQVDVVGGAIEEIDEWGKPRNKIIRYPLLHEECYRFYSKRDPLAHPAVMFRKSFFSKAGLYNERYRKNQDTQLWYQGFKNGCIFANLPVVLLQFRVTEAFYRSRRAGWERAIQMFKDRLKINRDLQYGFMAYIYAMGIFLITIAPTFIRKWAYKFLR